MASGATPLTSAARRGFFRGLLESGGVRLDESWIRQAVADDYVKHSHQQREIGSRPHRQIQVGVACNWSKARIGNNQLGALVAGAPDVVGSNGRTLSDVGADYEEQFCFRDIVPGVRRAVDTQRCLVGGAG